MGYCLAGRERYREAIEHYNVALEMGQTSPGLVNNIGSCWLMLGDLGRAETFLELAVKGDDRLQAAHHNLVVLALRRLPLAEPDEERAISHAERAIEVGSASYELYLHAAAIYALTAKWDSRRMHRAIEYLAKAVELGLAPEEWTAWAILSPLRDEPGFNQLLTKPAHRKVHTHFLVSPFLGANGP